MSKKSKKSKKDLVYQNKTVLQDVNASVTATQSKRGGIRLRGQLRDAKTGAVLETGSGSAISAEDAPVRAAALAARLVQKRMQATAKPAKALPGTAIFSNAYDGLSDKEKAELCPATWGETTRGQALKYFRLTMLPILDAYGDSLTQADAADILGQIREKAFNNTRRGESESVTENKVRQHANDFNRLYPMFRMATGEGQFPALQLPLPYRQPVVRSEHTKALPLEVQIKQIALYFRLVSNGLMLGAALMKLGGLRTGEVCGLRYKDIEFFEDFAVLWVLRQLKDKELSDDLKRPDSHRPVVVPRLALDLILARIEYLISLGYTREQIDEMPMVSCWDDPTSWATKGDLSGFVRGILNLLGITNFDWEEVSVTMMREPDRDENNKAITDPSAYLERRDNITMEVNVCGFDSDLADALAGHKLYCGSKKAEQIENYIHNTDKWPEIAAKLERLVLNPTHTANPLFRPIPLRKGDEHVFGDTQAGFLFLAEEDCEVEILISTVEAGDTVVIESDTRLLNLTAVSNPFMPTGGTVIGTVKERADYERLITEANALDISAFLADLSQTSQDEQQLDLPKQAEEEEEHEPNERQIS